MQDIINKKLKEKGNLYINEILNEVSPFLSEYKSWQLEQSTIKDLDKKIICKRVFNNGEFNGYKIVIETEEEEYVLFILKDFISLEKLYCCDDFSFKEFKSIDYDGNYVKLNCKYQENTNFSEYTEILKDNFLSFEEIIVNLKIVLENSKKYVRRNK